MFQVFALTEQTAKLLRKASEPLRDAPDIFFRAAKRPGTEQGLQTELLLLPSTRVGVTMEQMDRKICHEERGDRRADYQ